MKTINASEVVWNFFWAIVQNPILSLIIKFLIGVVAIYLGYLACKMLFKKD